MNINEFKQVLDNRKPKKIILNLQESSSNARKLSPEKFIFFEATIQYLITMISASVGKFAALGGEIAEDAFNVRLIGRAMDEDILFPGILLFWANVLDHSVDELEIDIRPVSTDEKESKNHHVKMGDVGAKADSVYFLESYEKVKDQINQKFGNGWFDNWPEEIRFAYIVRNALAHDGRWKIQEQKNRNHYQVEKFTWPRCGLTIQMRDTSKNPIDEGREVLEDLNGADFVVLLIEINELLNS
jgi:hypothetical protein